MKKQLIALLTLALTAASFGAETIYKGADAKEENVVCYYQGGKFFSDAARKNVMYSHPGGMVSKEAKATPKNAIYRLVGGRIYKDFSLDKKDCLGTFVETKTKKGDVMEGKIYEGFAVIRDVETEAPAPGVEVKKSFVVTKDGLPPSAENSPIKVLFTVKDGKVYRGESTDAKDCVLSYTGTMNSARLLFMAVELVK